MQLHPNARLTPVIVLTGQDAKETKRRAMESGATEFFEKTAGFDELLDAIERYANEDV